MRSGRIIHARSDKVIDATRYDRVTIWLHWATAALVVVLYGISQSWGWAPRTGGLHGLLINTHVSLGVLLTIVLLLRVLWRLSAGRRLGPVTAGLFEWAAEGAHYLLYALLLAAVALGFCLRWAQGRAPGLFGLFTVPSPIALSKADVHLLFGLHWWAATGIIVMAGLHAAAALFHHYVLRDSVLRRMLPGRSTSATVAAE